MNNETQIMNEFVERLIMEKDFENIDSEVREQIRQDLLERVEERINATILENMPTEKLEEFNALLNSANSDEIQSYCQKNISKLDEIIAESLVQFRDTYLNS